MDRALIGYTGFVGGHLREQRPAAALFNSKNFREMSGRTFDEVVCAGIYAVKWMANKEPERDRAAIAALEEVLSTVRAGRFILVSTIDVYPVLRGQDESFDCHGRDNHAYGRHRLAFEDFCRRTFPACVVVRLPALFGRGLKKNVLYDLMHDNGLDVINPASSFQYYGLSRLGADLDRVLGAGLDLVNLFPEPVPTEAILRRFFPGKNVGSRPAPEGHYDLRTRHAALWGRSDGYIAGREDVLEAMASFFLGAGKGGTP